MDNKKLKIGNIVLKNQLILAPMLDITNLPYRLICRKAGASLCFTEMINVPAILHKNKKTLQMMKTCKNDKPLGIQLTGNSVEEFKKAIPYLKKAKSNYDLIDINCGCPSEKTTGNESGSYLLKNPEKIANIIKILKKAGFIVTAKIRLGFNTNNVIKIAKAIEKAGADAITVHPRLANQGYDVPAQWQWIKKVKQAISIPVIGNGDILNEESAERMLKETGCDAVMIARGAIGDPLIFKRTLNYLTTGKSEPFDFKKNMDCFRDYLKLCEKYKLTNLPNIKHLGCKFIKGIQGAAKMRAELMQMKDFAGIKKFFG
ncbi:MAG: tRNA-dihydrouridine synthase family protein [Candidatus Pacearchaeota archaeon]